MNALLGHDRGCGGLFHFTGSAKEGGLSVRVTLQQQFPEKAERRCEASRLQEQILAAVYQLLVPILRRSSPSPATLHRCQGAGCVVANQPRNTLAEESS